MEVNCIPSQLNTSKLTGVASNLASVAENSPRYDGVTVEQMRGNPLYSGSARDDIDKVGAAQKSLADNAKIVKSRAKYIRSLNDAAQKVKKPANTRKF